jgi:hypothetical protein
LFVFGRFNAVNLYKPIALIATTKSGAEAISATNHQTATTRFYGLRKSNDTAHGYRNEIKGNKKSLDTSSEAAFAACLIIGHYKYATPI